MNTTSRKINWDRLGLIIGLIGFLFESLSFGLQAAQGNQIHITTLRIIGIAGIVLWAAWVTFSITRLHKRVKQNPVPTTANQLEGFLVKNVYFDATNRNFLKDLKFGHGDDAKGTELEKVDLAKVTVEGNQLKIQRIHKNFRWIMSVIKYQNTATAPNDRLIPADLDPSIQGDYARFIYFELKARVENEPHEITVRLRNQRGTWLKRGTTEENAARKVRVSLKSWENIDGILGPIQADQPCYISLDVMSGPAGDHQALYLRDLRIVELREQK